MVDRKCLMSKLTLNGTNVESLAKQIGLSKTALYRKINGSSDFYRREISSIKDALNLNTEEMTEIFFASKVS